MVYSDVMMCELRFSPCAMFHTVDVVVYLLAHVRSKYDFTCACEGARGDNLPGSALRFAAYLVG